MKKDDLIFEKFKNTVSSKHLIDNVDIVIVGLSGGSDSVSMLLLLNRLRLETNSFDIVALHFNHEIRGKEADEDEYFSKELCENLNIKFFAARGNVPEYSKIHKISLEEAARTMRYEALENLADKFESNNNVVRIAVAHNSDDKAETVLFNILRGTSVDGLHGIRYQNGKIIRPILDITKDETYEICRACNVTWRTDSTNLVDDCTRNKIRLNILPFLTKEMGMDVKEKILSLSSLSEKDSDYLTKVSAEEYKKTITEEGCIDSDKLKCLHEAIKSRVIVNAIKNVEIDGKFPFEGGNGISQTMVFRVINFIESSDKGTIELGRNVFLTKKDKIVILGKKPEAVELPATISPIEIDLDCDAKTIEIPRGNGKVIVNVLNVDMVTPSKLKMNTQVAYFDGDVLKNDYGRKIIIRNPKDEDRFFPFGGAGSKKLSRYLIDKKIQRENRCGLILISQGDKVLHIFDVARSKYAPVTEKTTNIIKVSIEYKQ